MLHKLHYKQTLCSLLSCTDLSLNIIACVVFVWEEKYLLILTDDSDETMFNAISHVSAAECYFKDHKEE